MEKWERYIKKAIAEICRDIRENHNKDLIKGIIKIDIKQLKKMIGSIKEYEKK